jgi:hypothetical protein
VPTVLTLRKISVRLYSNDHAPPHVHAVKKGGGRARFALNCPDGPVRLLESTIFKASEIEVIGTAIADDLTSICTKWWTIHGQV